MSEIYEALAEAFEAAAAALRRHGERERPSAPKVEHPGHDQHAALLERARRIHWRMGEQQAKLLPVVADAMPRGISAGDAGRKLGYDTTNASIALRAMVKAKLLARNESGVPYLFELAPELLDGAGSDDSEHGIE